MDDILLLLPNPKQEQKQPYFWNHAHHLNSTNEMSVDLQKENEALRKENEELKKEIQQLKTTLEKFKESSRFQVALFTTDQTVVEAAEGLQRFPKGAAEDHGR